MNTVHVHVTPEGLLALARHQIESMLARHGAGPPLPSGYVDALVSERMR